MARSSAIRWPAIDSSAARSMTVIELGLTQTSRLRRAGGPDVDGGHRTLAPIRCPTCRRSTVRRPGGGDPRGLAADDRAVRARLRQRRSRRRPTSSAYRRSWQRVRRPTQMSDGASRRVRASSPPLDLPEVEGDERCRAWSPMAPIRRYAGSFLSLLQPPAADRPTRRRASPLAAARTGSATRGAGRRRRGRTSRHARRSRAAAASARGGSGSGRRRTAAAGDHPARAAAVRRSTARPLRPRGPRSVTSNRGHRRHAPRRRRRPQVRHPSVGAPSPGVQRRVRWTSYGGAVPGCDFTRRDLLRWSAVALAAPLVPPLRWGRTAAVGDVSPAHLELVTLTEERAIITWYTGETGTNDGLGRMEPAPADAEVRWGTDPGEPRPDRRRDRPADAVPPRRAGRPRARPDLLLPGLVRGSAGAADAVHAAPGQRRRHDRPRPHDRRTVRVHGAVPATGPLPLLDRAVQRPAHGRDHRRPRRRRCRGSSGSSRSRGSRPTPR